MAVAWRLSGCGSMPATLFIFYSLDQIGLGHFSNTANDDQHATGKNARSFKSDRLAALGGFTCGRAGLLQPPRALGLHVGFGGVHLRRAEVADLVEGPKSYSPRGFARHRVSFGLARNGCGNFFKLF